MSMILTNGVELPDLPEELLNEYPHAAVLSVRITGEEVPEYGAIVSVQETLHVPAALTGEDYDMLLIPAGGYTLLLYEHDTGNWSASGEASEEMDQLPLMISEYVAYELVWTNHDVYTVTGVTEDYEPILGSEIYLKSCDAPKNFVLPDGTELAPLPEGVFEGYPCGAVFLLDGVYYLAETAAGLYLLPEGKWVCLQDGYSLWTTSAGAEAWAQVDDQVGKRFDTAVTGEIPELLWTNTDVTDWSDGWFVLPDGSKLPPLPEGSLEAFPYGLVLRTQTDDLLCCSNHELLWTAEGLSGEGTVWRCGAQALTDWSEGETAAILPDGEILWCNYDVVSTADGTIHRQSDVNYRIYGGWMRSVAGEARRLGSVTGACRPDAMETIFRAADTPLIDAETEVY